MGLSKGLNLLPFIHGNSFSHGVWYLRHLVSLCPGFSVDTSSNLFSLATCSGPASASHHFPFVFSLKTRIETGSFSEWTPHLFARQRGSIFGCVWKLGLEIYQSFLARAEAWRQRKRRSKVSFDLVQNEMKELFAVKILQKIASLLTSTYYSQQRLFNKLLLSLILSRQGQELLARSGKLCRNFTCPACYFCSPGQVGNR